MLLSFGEFCQFLAITSLFLLFSGLLNPKMTIKFYYVEKLMSETSRWSRLGYAMSMTRENRMMMLWFFRFDHGTIRVSFPMKPEMSIRSL